MRHRGGAELSLQGGIWNAMYRELEQRFARNNGEMPMERVQKLDKIGFNGRKTRTGKADPGDCVVPKRKRKGGSRGTLEGKKSS